MRTPEIVEELKQSQAAQAVVREDNTLTEHRGIVASPDNEYRYVLWRIWGTRPPLLCVFVMLNPSTADESKPDPTIAKCIGFATRWGFGGIVVVNLFAKRATDPNVLKQYPFPRGEHNSRYVNLVLKHGNVHQIVVAWGNDGSIDAADEAFFVTHVNEELWCLRPPGKEALTRLGAPRHPVRISYKSELCRVGWVDGGVGILERREDGYESHGRQY